MSIIYHLHVFLRQNFTFYVTIKFLVYVFFADFVFGGYIFLFIIKLKITFKRQWKQTFEWKREFQNSKLVVLLSLSGKIPFCKLKINMEVTADIVDANLWSVFYSGDPCWYCWCISVKLSKFNLWNKNIVGMPRNSIQKIYHWAHFN